MFKEQIQQRKGNKMITTRLAAFIERAAYLQTGTSHKPKSVESSYSAFRQTNRDLFLDIPDEINISFVAVNPYATSKHLFRDIEQSKQLLIFSGGLLAGNHPLAITDYGICENPTANLIFRAVHDYYGHFLNRIGFDIESELRTAIMQEKLLPEIALDALLCETVLQSAVYHVTGQFAEQKVFQVCESFKNDWREISALLINSDQQRSNEK